MEMSHLSAFTLLHSNQQPANKPINQIGCSYGFYHEIDKHSALKNNRAEMHFDLRVFMTFFGFLPP